MGVIAKYKFNQELYADFIPEFNSAFTNYTITDEIDTDGYTIRTIESDGLPTLIKFGAETQTDREKSLLEVYECNTEKVTNMSYMFQYCSSLISLDVSNFNTENVTTMSWMFNGCSSLISLDVSNFNTENVMGVQQMFNNCSSLTSLDVSNLNTENVANMYCMFYNCSKLTSLDVSNFNTEKVTNMQNMFNGCSSLTSLDVSNFNTQNVSNMANMFQNCSSLTSLDLSNFNTEKVTIMSWMFSNCSSLTSLEVSNFNTKNVTSMTMMFNNCSSLTFLDTSKFNTEKVMNVQGMFQNCSLLTSLSVLNFDTKNITNIGGMFYGCSSLTSLDVSNFNTENVTNMSWLFYNCSSLTSVDVSNFNTENVKNMEGIFNDCYDLTNVGAIYCDTDTINKISDLIKTNTTIWYMDSKLEDLTKKENITYKEYKMNILESNEEINLRRIGDIYDELNLETGKLTQRICEVVLDDSYAINHLSDYDLTNTHIFVLNLLNKKLREGNGIVNIFKTMNFHHSLSTTDIEGVWFSSDRSQMFIRISKTKLDTPDIAGFKKYLSRNEVRVQYELETESVKTVDLKNKPSINWQGDIYLHLENNTLYPQLDCEVESINYYEIPKLKANILYTLRYVGEPTQCIFGGLTYKAENNMILTSGSSDNLLYFDKEVRKVILIEGDVRDRNFNYFEGIESLGAVEIVTHKSNMPIFAKGGRK